MKCTTGEFAESVCVLLVVRMRESESKLLKEEKTSIETNNSTLYASEKEQKQSQRRIRNFVVIGKCVNKLNFKMRNEYLKQTQIDIKENSYF